MNAQLENLQKKHVKSKSLRYALLANGTFSLTSGIILLLIPHAISNLLGTTNLLPKWLFPAAGANLMIFGGALYFIAIQTWISKFWVKIAIALDISWVIGSIVIIALFSSLLSKIAPGVIFSVAFIVAIFAFLQWKYLHNNS